MRTLILTIVAASLSGCITLGEAERRAAQYDAQAAQKICDTLPTISYDGKLDTPLTKEQIKQYNAKRKAFCIGTTTNTK